jgi:hypothetical protein
MYMEVQVESYLALRSADAYLTDVTHVEAFAPSTVAENGYRRYTVSNGENSKFLKESVSADNAPAGYAFMQAGAFYGTDPSRSGGWLGVSSYLLTKGNITTRTNGFILPAEPGQPRRDVESVDVCIADRRDPENSCGATRTVLEGEFKFAYLGCTLGSEFAPGKDATHFGIRTRMDLVGTDITALTLNNDQTLASIGSTDVTKLVLTGGAASDRELTIEFPPSYNVGKADPDGFMNPAATKAVQVRVSQVHGEARSIYVDYLFEMPDLSGQYLIYGPKVAESTASSILDHLSWYAFDPVRVTFAISMVLYFVGCNFFLCTSSSRQTKFFEC